MNRLIVGCALAAAVCLGLAGCGPDGPALETVTGKVTLDAKPMPDVIVTFSGPAGSAVGVTDQSGQYTLATGDRQGAPIGTYTVSVASQRGADAAAASVEAGSADYEKQAAGGAADYNKAWVDPIPAKYNTSTELKKEVKDGSNTIDLELTTS